MPSVPRPRARRRGRPRSPPSVCEGVRRQRPPPLEGLEAAPSAPAPRRRARPYHAATTLAAALAVTETGRPLRSRRRARLRATATRRGPRAAWTRAASRRWVRAWTTVHINGEPVPPQPGGPVMPSGAVTPAPPMRCGPTVRPGLPVPAAIVLTQLTYQDPLKPVDNLEFVSQIAQFAQLRGARRRTTRSTNAVGASHDASDRAAGQKVDLNTSTARDRHGPGGVLPARQPEVTVRTTDGRRWPTSPSTRHQIR